MLGSFRRSGPVFDLKKHLHMFLSQHIAANSPVLVGFSGGVDSFSLLHAVQAQERRVVAVHVDHGWREESSQEAEDLRGKVLAMGIEYVCHRLQEIPSGVNVEDWSRNQRYLRFAQTAEDLDIHTILLAHQGDDQVETVIKRFLEGAAVHKLRGMKRLDVRNGLTILRPLLDVSKEDLYTYALAHSIPYITDPTNEDLSYLRPRLRHVIIPFLEKTFGKKIHRSILSLADETQELESYIETQLRQTFDLYEMSGLSIARSREEPKNHYLVRLLVRRLVALSRQQVDRAVEIFCSKQQEPAFFYTKNSALAVQGGILCTCQNDVLLQKVHAESATGTLQLGPFTATWKETVFVEQPPVDWRVLFSDSGCTLSIPPGPFDIGPTSSAWLSTASSRLSSPSVLRRLIPGVIQGFRLVGDFLSGYTVPLQRGDRCCEIILRSKNSPLVVGSQNKA